MEPDDVDRRVLAALLADGRASPAELGDVAGVRSSTASWRKELLETADVIRGYEPRLDYGTLDYITSVFRLEVAGTDTAAATAALCDRPAFHTVYEVTDPDDIVAIGKFVDRDALDAILGRLRADPRFAAVRVDTADPLKEYEFRPD